MMSQNQDLLHIIHFDKFVLYGTSNESTLHIVTKPYLKFSGRWIVMVLVLLDRLAYSMHNQMAVHFQPGTVKAAAFSMALLACLSAGSITLYSLYAESLSEAAHLSYLQINAIASCSALGMYLCLPVLGYLGDCHGPGLLALILVCLFCPSYFVCAFLYPVIEYDIYTPKFYVYSYGAAFFFIGLATSSLFFSSLISCAKIYPENKSLAISLPVTCFGLSTLVGSQMLKLDYFSFRDLGFLNLNRVFIFFGSMYLIVGLLNFVAGSLIIVEMDAVFSDSCPSDEHGERLECERSPLLPHSSSGSGQVSLRTQRSIMEPHDHRQRYIRFLRDPSAHILLMGLVLGIGPLECYQNNLGSIIKNVAHFDSTRSPNLSDSMSTMAFISTVTRCIVGAFSDFLASPNRMYPICRVWQVLFMMVVGIAGQVGHIFISRETVRFFPILVSLNGISYGGMFTIFPSIVASVWGIDMVGSTWGTFMVAPAIGSICYSLIYGIQVDTKCASEKGSCLSTYFSFSSASISASTILVLITWRLLWAKKGLGLI